VTAIDLNCDLGEIPALAEDGTDDAIMAVISSANIACGGHAGDGASMERAVRAAQRHRVAIGAHPSYPDRAGFGRRPEVAASAADVEAFVASQIGALAAIAARVGAELRHVKPHGALYHAASEHPAVAEAIGRAVLRVRRDLLVVGFAGSPALDVWGGLGLQVAGEAFADRRYEPGGGPRPRKDADALITAAEEAAEQAARIATGRGVIAAGGVIVPIVADSICVHGDTPGAAAIAAAVRRRLEAEGVVVRAP
jgi:5-oxoprolinase (ATP-hydrolysing) subunit A